MKRHVGALAVAVAALVGGCSDGGGTDLPPCESAPAALPDAPDLPPRFPTPEGVTYTGVQDAGPSTIVEGYVTADLDGAFSAYEAAFPEAGYNVTDSEQEALDAEVNYAGGNSNGQVRLTVSCEGRTDLSIIIRPA